MTMHLCAQGGAVKCHQQWESWVERMKMRALRLLGLCRAPAPKLREKKRGNRWRHDRQRYVCEQSMAWWL